MLFDNTIWWLMLLLAVPFWLMQNAIHEYSHGLMAKHWKYTIEKVRLYPDLVDKDKDGKIDKVYFAWIQFKKPEDREVNPTERGSIDIAPQLSNTAILTLSIMFRYVFFPDMWPWLASILALLAINQIVDASVNMSSLFKKEGGNDSWNFVKRWEINLKWARFGVIGYMLLWWAAILIPPKGFSIREFFEWPL